MAYTEAATPQGGFSSPWVEDKASLGQVGATGGGQPGRVGAGSGGWPALAGAGVGGQLDGWYPSADPAGAQPWTEDKVGAGAGLGGAGVVGWWGWRGLGLLDS